MISPTRGIDSPLEILQDGEQVLVTGHSNCGAGEQRYTIRVTVTQDGTKAKGETSGECLNGPSTWEAIASTLGPAELEPGPAQVCAMAVVKTEAF